MKQQKKPLTAVPIQIAIHMFNARNLPFTSYSFIDNECVHV